MLTCIRDSDCFSDVGVFIFLSLFFTSIYDSIALILLIAYKFIRLLQEKSLIFISFFSAFLLQNCAFCKNFQIFCIFYSLYLHF